MLSTSYTPEDLFWARACTRRSVCAVSRTPHRWEAVPGTKAMQHQRYLYSIVHILDFHAVRSDWSHVQ